MPIRDNRTLLDSADATTNFIDESGGTMSLSSDTSRIQGSASVSQQVSAARAGTFYDAGANQNWSGNVFYIWWNLTTANLLATEENLGVTVRFAAGADPSTNYFEIPIAGSDTYSGGFTMSVVDIDEARALALANSPQYTGGTPPAASAIQYVGIMWDVVSMIPGTDPNAFLDAIWRLPSGTPGIIVSGENTAGSPNPKPWTWDDIVDAGDITDTSKAWGTISKSNGVITVNTPIQFGAAGSPNTDHDFEDTLAVVTWESQLVRDDFYGVTILGDATNNTRFVMGVNGSAGLGMTMLAASDGPRWFLDATDPNVDQVDLLGCSLTHSRVIDIDNPAVKMYDSLLIDGQRLWHSRTASPRSGADFQRNSIIAADAINFPESPTESPDDEVSYIWTADPDLIQDCDFTFSDGHAIRITEVSSYNFIGNTFTGYGADDTTDAAIHAPPSVVGLTLAQYNMVSVGSPIRTNVTEQPFSRVLQPGLPGYFYGQVFPWDGTSKIRSLYGSIAVNTFGGDEPSPNDPWINWHARLYNTVVGEPGEALVITGGVDGHIAKSSAVPHSTLDTGASTITTHRKSFVFSPEVEPPAPTTSPSYLAFLMVAEVAPGFTQSPVLTATQGTSSYHVFRRNLGGGEYSPRRAAGGFILANRNESPEIRVLGPNLVSPEPYQEVMDYGVFSGTVQLTLNITDGDTPTVDGDATLNNNVAVTITNIQPGTEIRVYPSQNANSPQDLTEIAGVESTGSPAEFTFTASAGLIVDIVVLNVDYVLPPANRIRDFVVPTTSTSFPISQLIDRNFSNP
jgi:hypothetical protein